MPSANQNTHSGEEHLRPLTWAECRDLFRTIESDQKGAEVKDVIAIVLNTGIGLCELRRLRVSDVDFNNQTMRIACIPGRDRSIPFNGAIAGVLKRRVKDRGSSDHLFSAALLIRSCRRLAKITEATLGRALSLHALRLTFAANMLAAGMDISVLAWICGWRGASSPIQHLCSLYGPHIEVAYRSESKKQNR